MGIDEELGFTAGVLPQAGSGHPLGLDMDPLDEVFEGIGPPLEEELHEVDPLHEALLDEGGLLEEQGDAEDDAIVEWAIKEEAWGISPRRAHRPEPGA